MAEAKTRADVVAERLAAWAPDLDAIAQTREAAAADQAAADAAVRAVTDLQEVAIARFAYLENCAALGVEPEADPVADEAIAILEAIGADADD